MNQFKQLQTFKRGVKMTAKALLFLIALIAGLSRAQAQLTVTVTNSGNTTPNLASSYSSLASAIADLNAVTAFSGPVTLTCSGTSETAPTGGFVITYTTATTPTNNVVINGGNTTIRAAAIATAGGAATGQADAVIKIVGSDNLTIQNFTITENSANTVEGALSAQRMTEFGIGLFAASATDGAQNNTIQNNTIIMSNGATRYRNSVGIFSTSASAHTAPATARLATSTAGTNSNNKIYGNTISGVAVGVYFVSAPETVTVQESGNDVGGTSLSTGNTITYGVSNSAFDMTYNLASTTVSIASGVAFRNGAGNNIRFNTITNVAALTLINAGIYCSASTAPVGITFTNNYSDNTITITQTASVANTGIDFGSGIATGTITCNNNRVTINHTSIVANSAADIGIRANYVAASSSVNFNVVVLNEIFNPTATLIHSGALTGILLPSGTTGTPTMTAIGDSITISRSISVPASFTATFSGANIGISGVTGATTFQIGNTGAGNGNVITMYEIPSASGTGISTFSAVVTGISVAGATGIANLYILNNTIGNGRTFKNYSTSTLTGINHGATLLGGTLNISTNTISFDRSLASATGTFTGISSTFLSTVTMPGGYSVSDNNISFTGSQVVGSAGTATGITNSDGLTATTVNKSFNNNTINLSGVMTTGTGITFSYGNTINVTNNTISINASVSGTQFATVTGIISGGTATTTVNVYSNIFNALNVTSTSSGTCTIFAISSTGGPGTTNIYNHDISNISSGAGSGAATIGGISISGGGTVATNVYKNKISNLQLSNTNVGSLISLIRVTGGTNINVYNNLISQTNALTGATNPNAIIGINITSTTITSNINLYYNTIYLSSSSSGTNFGGTGVSHTTNATATTASLSLRNNIIVNNIAPTGTGTSYAYRRSSAVLDNFSSSSNNNLFFCPTGIYNDGTNTATTMGAYKGFVSPKESNSVSENLTWLNNSNPAGANFLQLDPSAATQVESGAVAITGYNDDYNTAGARASYPLSAQTNGGGIAPDMGAQEMDLTPADFTGPSIIYIPLANTTDTSALTLTATISDASGVPTSGAGLPVLYWRVGNSGPYLNAIATWVSGNTYTFTFGGGSANDQIQYFIAAQDNAATPNVSITGIGSSGTSTNPPACSTPPTTTNLYTILSIWNGTYVIGGNAAGPASGADYVSLGEAMADVTPTQIKSVYLNAGGSGYATAPVITFTGGGGIGAQATAFISGGVVTRILITSVGSGYTSAPTVVITSATGTGAAATANLSTGKALSGPVTLSLSSNYDGTLYEGVFPITITDIGQTASNTLTIKPAAGVSASIFGNSGTSIFYLNGADYTTIDGSNNGTASRNISVTNTSIGATTSVIQIRSLGAGLGATNSTIKNLNISNGSSTTANFGIVVGGAALGLSNGADNDNVTIQNNNISNVGSIGIYAYGTDSVSTGGLNNLSITDNIVTINTTTTASPIGIQVGRSLNSDISRNTIDVFTTASGQPTGLSIETGMNNSTINKNKITRSVTTATGGYGGRGITIGTGLFNSNLMVSNNLVLGVNGSNWSTYGNSSSMGIGIGVLGTSSTLSTITRGINLYYNSVNLYGVPAIATGVKVTAALWVGTGAGNLDIRNNSFANTIFNSANATEYSYAVFCEAATNAAFTTMDNNNLWVDTAVATGHGILGSLGSTTYLLANTTKTLAGFITMFGGNVNSKFANPEYNSNTVLFPAASSPLLASGTPVSITEDYKGIVRSSSTPSIGAYENGGDGAPPVITYTKLKNTQVVTSRTLVANIIDGGVGTDSTVLTPRLYFRKSTDGNTFGVANNSTGNGWKSVTSTNNSNPYNFNMDFSLLRSSLSLGDVIQYFVVAQDYNANIDANPSTGFAGTDVNTVISGPTTANSFIVVGAPISAGTYTIGTSSPSTYPTITAAELDVTLRGITGPVVYELVDTAYTETTETFPITFGNVDGASMVNTITYRPSSSATFVRVGDSTNSTASTTVNQGLFNFSNGSYYVWDGRAGGTGTTPVLNIVQNNASGYAIQIRDDSRFNTFTYNTIKACGTGITSVPILIPSIVANSLTLVGNDSNIISYNNIGPSKTATVYCGITSYGVSDAVANDFNQYIGNNIYNYQYYGMYHYQYQNNDLIQGNSFYQTAPLSTITYTIYNYTPNARLDIKDNFIGGTAPQCGGSPMTYNGSPIFYGVFLSTIALNTSNTPATNITGNTFKNIIVNTTTTSTTHSFVYVSNGRLHIDNNIFGSQTDTSSFVLNSTGTSSTFSGVYATTGFFDTLTINNNQFGGFTFNQVGNVGGTSMRCIDLDASTTGYVRFNNNLVGGTVANSMMQRTANSILAVSIRRGSIVNRDAQQVNNNIVRNCTTAISSSSIQGMLIGGTTASQIMNNTIYNLTARGSSSIGINATFAGSDTTASVISGNNVYGLYMTGAAGTSNFSGMQLATSTKTNVSVTSNKIHSMGSTNAGNVINGILISASFNVANNMIRLGLDESGNDITTSTSFNGINLTSGSSRLYFNTVLIAGSGVGAGTDSSYAIRSSATTGTNNVRNNIFVNNRQSGLSTGKHYAVTFAGNAPLPTGLTLNYNNYYTPVPPLGFYNGVDRNGLGDWKSATGLDANSINEAPVFVSASGTSSTFDLHITPGTQSLMESGGVDISGYTTDFDGDARPGPAGGTNGGGIKSDIGADEFDGSLFPTDMGVQTLVSPSGTCATSGKTVTVRVKNYSTKTINFALTPVTIYGSVAGANPTSFNPIVLGSDSLQAGATSDIVLSSNYDMSNLGTYTFDAYTSVTGDASTSNDAMSPTVVVISNLTPGTITTNFTSACQFSIAPTFTTTATGGDIQWVYSTVSKNGPWINVGTNAPTYTASAALTQSVFYTALLSCNSTTVGAGDTLTLSVPVVVSSTPASRCGTGTVNLGATAGLGSDINWYNTPVGGVAVGTGPTFTTPTINATTNYYAAAATSGTTISQVAGGITWDQYTTGGIFQTTNHTGANMVFDALSDITIASLDIYPAAAIGTSFTIEVRQTNSTGTLIASYTDVTTVQNSGTPTIAQTVPVNFQIPAGTAYSIGFVNNPNTWRAQGATGQIPYPFVLPSLISISGSSFGASPPTANNYQYYFYNWMLGGGCESARTIVTATVTAPPALALSSANADICLNTPSNTISITPATVSNYDTYSWSPNTNISGNSSTGYVFNPAATTTYTLSASQTAGSLCATTMNFTVSVNPLPSAVSVSPSMATFSAGGKPVKLTATGGRQSANGTLGNGASTTAAMAISPFDLFYEGSHKQYLVTKAELNAMGIYAGDITSLGFNVTTQGGLTFNGGGTAIFNNYKIKMGHTAATVMPAAYINPTGGFTDVYGPVSVLPPAIGWTTFTFGTSFLWDGASNVVIDICHDNDLSATCNLCYATSGTVSAHATSVATVYGSYNDNAPACGITAGTVVGPGTLRPDMKFSYQAPATITWSPITELFVDSNATNAYTTGKDTAIVYSAPTANRIYTVTATNRFGCTSQSTDTIIFINSASLALKAFLQGMYLGSGSMTSAPFNADGVTSSSIADTITVELHDPTNSAVISYSATALLNTSGIANVTFPGGAIGNSYYIYIKHRNSITTSSANPVQINASNTSFDFSSALTQSFGDNAVDDGSGVFMIYTGDINQDGSVDFNDYPNLDIASSGGVLGYDPNDLNGDASVDFNDYPLIDVNSSNGVISILP